MPSSEKSLGSPPNSALRRSPVSRLNEVRFDQRQRRGFVSAEAVGSSSGKVPNFRQFIHNGKKIASASVMILLSLCSELWAGSHAGKASQKGMRVTISGEVERFGNGQSFVAALGVLHIFRLLRDRM